MPPIRASVEDFSKRSLLACLPCPPTGPAQLSCPLEPPVIALEPDDVEPFEQQVAAQNRRRLLVIGVPVLAMHVVHVLLYRTTDAQRAVLEANPLPPLTAPCDRNEATVELWFQLRQ